MSLLLKIACFVLFVAVRKLSFTSQGIKVKVFCFLFVVRESDLCFQGDFLHVFFIQFQFVFKLKVPRFIAENTRLGSEPHDVNLSPFTR